MPHHITTVRATVGSWDMYFEEFPFSWISYFQILSCQLLDCTCPVMMLTFCERNICRWLLSVK